MHEPITLVKVRKDTKVTISAGGWLLLAGPDIALHEQIERRSGLINQEAVNGDYEKLLLGRLEHIKQPLNFLTEKEKAAADKLHAESHKSLVQSHTDALAREKTINEKNAKHDANEHAKRVEALNKQNDSIRNRTQPK